MQNFMKTILSAVQTWTTGKIQDSTADWSQNDDTADNYVKNKPFYEEDGVVYELDEKYISSSLSVKMNNENPVGTGSFSMNRLEGSEVGECSHTDGNNTTASGYASHAQGNNTVAAGWYTHTEGNYTATQSKSQHVQGEFNILDETGSVSSRGDYAHIVGNGTADDARSNAHTLDWEGNAWYQGDVYVGSTSGTNKDEGSEKLARVSEIPNVPDWAMQESMPHRKLVASYTSSGTYTFNTTDYPSINGYYDIILIGAGGGGGFTLGSSGGGGGEVVEKYGTPMNGTYGFEVGEGGVAVESGGTNGGNTYFSLSTGASLASALGGKGASSDATIFTGFAGGNGGEDGHASNTTCGILGRGGNTRYGLGVMYYNDGSSYQTREATLGGGGAYLASGADGAVYVYAYTTEV